MCKVLKLERTHEWCSQPLEEEKEPVEQVFFAEVEILPSNMEALAVPNASGVKQCCSFSDSVFKYDERCPADLAEKLDECRANYLVDSQLSFHSDNDLIAEGRRRDIRRACK